MKISKKELTHLVKNSYEEGWIDAHHDCIAGEGNSRANELDWATSDSFESLNSFIEE